MVYEDLFERIASRCRTGLTLEVGGGSGNFKELYSEVITIDIQALPWVDVVADGHFIPFADCSFDNIVMIDTLHHLERPYFFFQEVSRLLKLGGRLVLVEPMITPLSYFFYKFFHPELVDMSEDPLAEGSLDPGRDPFDSNQAIPTLLFRRYRKRFESAFPDLSISQCHWFSLFAYPLSGGFRPWCLLPASLTPALLRLERKIERLIAPLMGFRMIVVIEKIEGRHCPSSKYQTEPLSIRLS